MRTAVAVATEIWRTDWRQEGFYCAAQAGHPTVFLCDPVENRKSDLPESKTRK